MGDELDGLGLGGIHGGAAHALGTGGHWSRRGGEVLNEGRKPCCAAVAAAQLRYLIVGGHRIAIAQLDEILEKAAGAASGGENAVREELVRLVKIYNYVPPPAQKDYEDALFSKYLAWKGHGTEPRGKEIEGKGR